VLGHSVDNYKALKAALIQLCPPEENFDDDDLLDEEPISLAPISIVLPSLPT